jgi:hypothetical protein
MKHQTVTLDNMTNYNDMTLSSVKHQTVIFDNMTNHDMKLSSVKPQTRVADNTTLNNSCRTYNKQERYEQLICPQTSNDNGRKYHNMAKKLDNGNRSSVKPQTSC